MTLRYGRLRIGIAELNREGSDQAEIVKVLGFDAVSIEVLVKSTEDRMPDGSASLNDAPMLEWEITEKALDIRFKKT